MPPIKNLFAQLPASLAEEQFEELLRGGTFRLERIVSAGHATPPGQWYDEDQPEWVILLAGSAGLLFEGEDQIRSLLPGDFLAIPAHLRHRVEWTDPNARTIWLALHYEPLPTE